MFGFRGSALIEASRTGAADSVVGGFAVVNRARRRAIPLRGGPETGGRPAFYPIANRGIAAAFARLRELCSNGAHLPDPACDCVLPEADSTVAVPVWDWPVRVAHWVIVLLVVALVTTGKIGNEALVWHMRFGETLLVVVLFRIVWGFAGSGNARFASFLRGPAAIARYARSLLHGPHEVHATHNPLGGWMVIALLLAMLVQAGAGLMTQDDIGNEGPLVKHVSDALSERAGYLHRRAWWVVAGLAAVHIAAVVAYLVVLRDNLVRPMFSGEKRLPAKAANPAGAAASTPRALVLLAVCAAVVWWVVNRL